MPLLEAMRTVGQVALILDPSAELSQGLGTGFGNQVCRAVELSSCRAVSFSLTGSSPGNES